MSKAFVSGWETRKVKSYNYEAFVMSCDLLKSQGYELHKAKRKTQWPFFWISLYRAEFRKYFVMVDEDIAYYSKQEIDMLNPFK